MTGSRKTLVAAASLTFLAGIVLLFPARVAYQWFVPESLRISGIDGTIWSGSAREIASGGVYLRNLNWRMQAYKLVIGRLAYSITANPTSGFIETDIGIGFGGTVTLSDLTGSLALQSIQSAANMPGLAGNASVQMARLQIRDGLPIAADGVVNVSGLFAPQIVNLSLGGYKAEFNTQDDGIVASIEDTDGIVDLAGSLQVSSDRSYRFVGQLAAKPDTPQRLREQMQFLGSANERGQYPLRLEGQL